jgi:hypothetical protein
VVPRALSAAALVLVFAASSAQANGDRGDLFGRGYVSTAVRKDGDRLPLFGQTKIDVDFNHRAGYDVVTWQADCNDFGAHVEITDARLRISQVVGTTEGCPKPRARRDRWMVRFFRSHPQWRIRRDDRVKLTAGDRVIRLRKLTSPPRDR